MVRWRYRDVTERQRVEPDGWGWQVSGGRVVGRDEPASVVAARQLAAEAHEGRHSRSERDRTDRRPLSARGRAETAGRKAARARLGG